MNPWVWVWAQSAGVGYIGVCKYKSESDCCRNPAETEVLLWKTWPWQMCFHIQRQGNICQKVHTIQNTSECDSEFELSHLWDLRDSVRHLPGIVEDFQLRPLCNSITKLPDVWCCHLWERVKSYSELHLLHILGFNIEIMSGFRWTCIGWRFVEDESGLWAVCHIYP